ncbi:MAG: lamin tail domain-containing protein [Bacteroidales bacterium]|nr:lamin tail domain-containing protein [Bacteroidales bacterium]
MSGTGTSAYIKVTANNNADTELYGWDNLEVTGITTVTRVQFVFSSSTQSEDFGTYNLTLEILEEDANNATDCEVALTNGSASDVDNYTTQSVTFPAGSSSNQTVMITITDDSDYEGDETLTFEIQNVSGGDNAFTGHPSTFDLTIEDNDLPGLVITEIMPDPDAVGDSDGEWFEIYNTGSNTVDLDGFTISDAGSDSFTISNSLIISADSYLVFAENTSFNQNGGLIVVL